MRHATLRGNGSGYRAHRGGVVGHWSASGTGQGPLKPLEALIVNDVSKPVPVLVTNAPPPGAPALVKCFREISAASSSIEQRRTIAAELALAQRARGVPVLSSKAIQARLRGFLGDWDALLEASTVEARGVLDGVLADRICFTPDRAKHRYTLTLPIAFDRVMMAALPELGGRLQETVASPRGTADGWQLDVEGFSDLAA